MEAQTKGKLSTKSQGELSKKKRYVIKRRQQQTTGTEENKGQEILVQVDQNA